MSILDKLIEKKDLTAYIHFRIKRLKKFNVKEFNPKDRNILRERNVSKIKELRLLKKHINNIRKQSKIMADDY